MTKLERLLKHKKFFFLKDWEGQISVKFFKHSFLLIENSYDQDKDFEYTEWFLTVVWDSTSKISKQETKKAFIKFVKLLKTYQIKYIFDENLDFNN